jgi:hypothetical protein
MKNKKLKAQTLLEIAFKKNYKLMKKTYYQTPL